MMYFQGRIVWDDTIFHQVTQNGPHKNYELLFLELSIYYFRVQLTVFLKPWTGKKFILVGLA